MKARQVGIVVVLVLALCGCRSAYYSTMEKFGVYKRDLLKKSVTAARDGQSQAAEQFKDALTRLRELYNFQGGDLEKTYEALNREYERSVRRASTVRKRIADMETVARDLFAEWEKEIKEYSSESLRQSSRQKLQETKRRYEELHTALKRAEEGMEPVLVRLHDQVLYVKHNLNAAAIASLKGESTEIQTEIATLLEEMKTAIAKADSFITALQ